MKIIREEKFRSAPGMNTSYDIVRITIDCTIQESIKISKLVKENPDGFPPVRNENIGKLSSDFQLAERFASVDPNSQRREWQEIFTDQDRIDKSAQLNKHRLERWVNGSPGVDSGYILVNRFIQIIDKKPQPFITIELRGTTELTENMANNIRRQFLGEYILNG